MNLPLLPSISGDTASNRLQPETCLICDAAEGRTLCTYEEPDAYEQAVGVGAEAYARQWVRCTGCGFCYSRYSRDPEILDRIYESSYRDSAAAWRPGSIEQTFARVVALPPEESETVARITWIKERIDELRAAGVIHWPGSLYQLLDIGGATCVFAYLFQDRTWRAAVIDPSQHGRFLSRDHGIEYLAAPYAAGAFSRDFQLISMIFVLEHLRDPAALLLQTRQDLAPGGLLYIEVPDAIAFDRKPAGDDIFNSCHLWMFSPASLTRLLDIAGYEVQALTRTRTKRGHYALAVLAGASNES